MCKYKELQETLDDRHAAYKENGKQLDANWVGVTFASDKVSEAKAAGAKKDSYYGWILWSGSLNCDGTAFEDEVQQLIRRYPSLNVKARQL